MCHKNYSIIVLDTMITNAYMSAEIPLTAPSPQRIKANQNGPAWARVSR